MRTYETTKRMVEVEDKKETIACDLCDNKEGIGKWNDSSGWGEFDETEIEVTIKQKEGDEYPEGGCGEKYVVDLCPDCFKNKLIPWLQSQGAKIKQLDWDY